MSQQRWAVSPTASWEQQRGKALLCFCKYSPSLQHWVGCSEKCSHDQKIIRRLQQAALELELTRSGKVTSGEIFTGTSSNSPSYLAYTGQLEGFARLSNVIAWHLTKLNAFCLSRAQPHHFTSALFCSQFNVLALRKCCIPEMMSGFSFPTPFQ